MVGGDGWVATCPNANTEPEVTEAEKQCHMWSQQVIQWRPVRAKTTQKFVSRDAGDAGDGGDGQRGRRRRS